MNQVVHIFRDGNTDPTTKVVPDRIMARMEQILADAKSRKEKE